VSSACGQVHPFIQSFGTQSALFGLAEEGWLVLPSGGQPWPQSLEPLQILQPNFLKVVVLCLRASSSIYSIFWNSVSPLWLRWRRLTRSTFGWTSPIFGIPIMLGCDPSFFSLTLPLKDINWLALPSGMQLFCFSEIVGPIRRLCTNGIFGKPVS
jgi:hypothetical protein